MKDWTDQDVAAYILGIAIGVVSEDDTFQLSKPTFVKNNKDATVVFMNNLLEELSVSGFLEKRKIPKLQYRWKESEYVNDYQRQA